jgi:uncharacterized protein
MRHYLMLGLGYGFLVLGVAGLVLPFLQGFLFLAIGLAILARRAAWARWLRQRLRQRFPQIAKRLDEGEARLAAWWRRLAARFGSRRQAGGASSLAKKS